MQVSARLAEAGHTSVIVSGEESVEQIASRARRLNISTTNLLLAGEHSLDGVLAHVEEHSPTFLVVDSVQTISSPHVDSRAGSVPQVHEIGSALTRLANTTNTVILAIAQITRDAESVDLKPSSTSSTASPTSRVNELHPAVLRMSITVRVRRRTRPSTREAD
jgi:Predicted ATP-dependent serine protease